MADLYVFSNTPYGEVHLKDTDPPWLIAMWISFLTAAGCKPDNAPYAPIYEEQHFEQQDEQVPPAPLNTHFFASAETADDLMHRFGAVRVASVPKKYTVPAASERWLVWADDIAVNAGLLGERLAANPKAQNAEGNKLIDSARADGHTIDRVSA